MNHPHTNKHAFLLLSVSITMSNNHHVAPIISSRLWQFQQGDASSCPPQNWLVCGPTLTSIAHGAGYDLRPLFCMSKWKGSKLAWHTQRHPSNLKKIKNIASGIEKTGLCEITSMITKTPSPCMVLQHHTAWHFAWLPSTDLHYSAIPRIRCTP